MVERDCFDASEKLSDLVRLLNAQMGLLRKDIDTILFEEKGIIVSS